MEMYIKIHNEKSFLVYGKDTFKFKDDFPLMGGVWNKPLKSWVFSIKKRWEQVNKWILSLKDTTKKVVEKKTVIEKPKTKSKLVFDKSHEYYEQVTNSKEYLILEYIENISFESFHSQTGYSQTDLNISHRKRIRGNQNVLDCARFMIDMCEVFGKYTESEVADIICETFMSTPTQSALITKLIAKFEGEKENYFAEAEFLSKDCPF